MKLPLRFWHEITDRYNTCASWMAVTGDKQLQRVGKCQAVTIMSPLAFLDLLREVTYWWNMIALPLLLQNYTGEAWTWLHIVTALLIIAFVFVMTLAPLVSYQRSSRNLYLPVPVLSALKSEISILYVSLWGKVHSSSTAVWPEKLSLLRACLTNNCQYRYTASCVYKARHPDTKSKGKD
jgi:hypothetical protein